jgi:hypothetical protein
MLLKVAVLVKVTLTGRNGKFIATSKRSAMLRYKSWILHFLGTVMFSPAMLLGPIMEEKQTLKVEMFSEFLEAPVCSGSFLYAFLSLFVLINSNKRFFFFKFFRTIQ